jgi:hypothetical protein
VECLNPLFAIPFATDFVLLDEHQRWINSTKFPRSGIKEFYKTFTKGQSAVEVIEAYPDDYFSDGVFYRKSSYHQKAATKSLLDSIDEDYSEEIAYKKSEKKLEAAELNHLFDKLKKHILEKNYIIPEPVRKKIKFAIRIVDGEKENILQVNFREPTPVFSVTHQHDEDIDLLIAAKSKTLSYAIDNEWGGDAIIIGYGAEIYIYKEDAVVHEYENYCVRLLSRYPNTREYLKKTPFRALKYLLSDDTKRSNLIQKLMGNSEKIVEYTAPLLGKRDLWLSKSKCDVCKACNI